MKEKKQLEIETKIKNADKQIEAKSYPITGVPGTGGGWSTASLATGLPGANK